MKTSHILLLQYEGSVIIPAASVARDYFDLSETKFLQGPCAADIWIPLMKPGPSSQKGLQGIHVQDLVEYMDKRRGEAQSDLRNARS